MTDEDRDGWSGVGAVDREDQHSVHEVLDRGDTWIFRFTYAGQSAETQLSRDQLERNDWQVTVPDEPAAGRYIRGTTIAAVVGLLHPAIVLSARDIIGQVGIELPDDDAALRHRQRRAATAINALAIASLVPLAAIVGIGVM